MAMTRAEARTAINSTFEEVSGAPSSTDLNTWIDLEHKLVLRELAHAAPSSVAAVSSNQTLASGDTELFPPAFMESVIRVERQSGSAWVPVDVSDELTPHIGGLTYREESGALVVSPTQLAPGTYRIVYTVAAATMTADGDLLQVPPGIEDVIIERVAARCRVRLDEDPTPHLQRADAVWKAQLKALKKRYGRHPVPGLRQTRRW